MNKNISYCDLKQAFKKWKLGKSSSLDRTSKEMLNFGFQFLMKITIKAIQNNYGWSDWCKGSISSIFKADNRFNPDNYRGTCVIRRLRKLFFLVLNVRQNELLKVNNTINKCLIDLQKNNRTTDHTFPLKILLNKYAYNTNEGKFHSCFVDFRKAYDSLWHEGRASLQNYLE